MKERMWGSLKSGIVSLAVCLALLLAALPGCAWAAMMSGSAGLVINAPAGADVTLYEQLTKTSGTEYAYDEVQSQADGTVDYVFYKTINDNMSYRVGGDNYVTYAGTVPSDRETRVVVTETMLKADGRTKSTLDRDLNSNGGTNMADLYLNINAAGYLRLSSGDSYQLAPRRNWWGSNVTWILSGVYRLIEPDYHYTVLDMDGQPANDVVSVNDKGRLQAVGKGTAIVLVTYDAMTLDYWDGHKISYEGYDPDGFYGAIWPENTGVFVVSVDAPAGDIAAGLTINEGKNAGLNKEAGDKLDAELDVIYFTGEQGQYKFTPQESGVGAAVANPAIIGDKLVFNGFTELTADADGQYTVPLTEGRNIIRVTKGSRVDYQVVTARQTSVTVNGRPLDEATLCPGEEVSVVFDTVFNPVTRMSIYNTDASLFYSDVSGYPGLHAGNSRGAYGYYFWASNAAKHTIANFAAWNLDASGYANSIVSVGDKLTVPADYIDEYFTLSDGTLTVGGFGADYGAHREMKPLPPGNKPNTQAYMGALPDISVPIVELQGISVARQPDMLTYNIGDVFDPAGMVIEADYGDFTEQVTDGYSCDTAPFSQPGVNTVKVSYTRGEMTETTEVQVTVTDIELDRIGITAQPTKRMYNIDEVFDPAGMVVTAVYSDGTRRDISGYTCSQNPLSAEDSAVSIGYGAKTCAAKIKMRLVESIEITDPPDVTVYTEGQYFSDNGMVVTVTYTDGSAENSTYYSCKPKNLSAADDEAERRGNMLMVGDNAIEIYYVGVDCTADLAPAVYPITVIPAGGGNQDDKPSITAYISYSDAGSFVRGKDGTLLCGAPVKVYDTNGDGKYTMGEAFAAMHGQYFAGGSAGYEETATSMGGWVNKFWGDNTGNISYCLNNAWVGGTQTEIRDGDKLGVFAYNDIAQYTDLYAWFAQDVYNAKPNTEVKFTVNGLSVMQSSDTAAVTAAPAGANVDVYNSADAVEQQATVGEDGTFTVSFPAAGIYTLEVNGLCSYTVESYGGAAAASYKDATVAPARCTVIVAE